MECVNITFPLSSLALQNLKLQLFKPKETEVFIRFVKWALQALDVYTLSMKPTTTLGMAMANQRPMAQQTVRTQEEKVALEHFSGVVSVYSSFDDRSVNLDKKNCSSETFEGIIL